MNKNYPGQTEKGYVALKKIWIFVLVGFLLIVTAIGLGGEIYMDKKAEEKEAEKIEAERMSVEALKNTFEDIQVIKFKYTSYEEMVGGYFMTINMININNQEVEFRYSFSKGDEKITSFKVVDDNIQSKGKTTKKVKVIFSNEKEEEI